MRNHKNAETVGVSIALVGSRPDMGFVLRIRRIDYRLGYPSDCVTRRCQRAVHTAIIAEETGEMKGFRGTLMNEEG